ncbi:MAG: Ig-like domain-containing protein [Myxococcota bacterium]
MDNGGCDPRVACSDVGGAPECGACPDGTDDVNGDGTLCEDELPDGQPSARDDAAVVGESSSARIEVLVNDSFGPDGAGALELVRVAIAGEVRLDDGGTPSDASDDAFLYTPEEGFTGTGSFVYQVVDADGDAAEATVALEVTAASLTIAFTFPTPGALLGGEPRFAVRGVLANVAGGEVSPADVLSIEVNGAPAALDPVDPSVWRAEVSLERTSMDLVATVVSRTGRHSRTMRVNNEPMLDSPEWAVLGADEARLYVVDSGLDALLSVDVATGERAVVSDNAAPSSGPSFAAPASLALNGAETTAYVLDVTEGRVAMLSVDLTTGGRAVVSDDDSAGPAWSSPRSVVVSADETTAYVVDPDLDALLSVDLATGQRAVVSDASTPTDGPALSSPHALALSADETTAYVVNRAFALVVSVDLATGERTLVSENSSTNGPSIGRARSLVVNADETAAYVVDANFASVLSVDLATGVRTELSSNSFPNGGRVASDVRSLVVSADEATGFMVDAGIQVLFAVDLATGARTGVSGGFTPSGGPPLYGPRSVAVTADETTAYVADEGFFVDALVAVDLATGARRVVSGEDTPSGGPPLRQPNSVALSADESTAYVVDGRLDALLSVDLATGVRTVLSDGDTPRGGPRFVTPTSVALTADETTAYVGDSTLDALLSVDLETGVRTVVSGDDTPGAGSVFFGPRSIALTADETTAWVADLGVAPGLWSVNLATGRRRYVAGNRVDGVLPFTAPQSLALRADERAVVMVDRGRVLSVDLATGRTSVLSDDDTPNGGPALPRPASVALSADERTAYVAEASLGALFVVDLATGTRAIVSR